MTRVLLLGLGLLVAASACRSPGSVPDARLPVAGGADGGAAAAGVLGVNDVVEVKVFGEPDFSGAYRVSSSGTIDYPFCKQTPVVGLRPEDVAAALTVCLQPRVLKNPQLVVSIREYNSKKVFILGEVQKPGTLAYEDRMTIIQAITLAGGFTKTAAKNACNLTRVVGGQERKVKVVVEDIAQGKAPNVTLEPGDIIFVPESFF